MEFHGGQVWCWCADISWIIYNIYSCSEYCNTSFCFMRSDITYLSHKGWLSVPWFVLVEYELYYVCSWIFQLWDRRPSSLHIEFVHTGASILTRSLYPNIFPLFFQLIWFAIGSTVILFFWGLYDQGSLWLYMLLFFLPRPF